MCRHLSDQGRCIFVAGFAAGSASDINARLFGQWLAERLGQPFIIDNRAGAGGNIATEFVVRAPADGYTLLYASTAIAINETLYAGKLSFNAQKDLAPVASVVRTPVVMEVNRDLSGQDRCRIHRLRQGQSGQSQFRDHRRRQPPASVPASISR